jgi:hypothetical protein
VNDLKPVIAIYENYGTYKPSVNARKIVEDLLASVDPDYLQGLGSIAISSQTDLPRKKRRQKFLSRSRKYEMSNVQAYYQRPWKGQPAFIELYVDKILAGVPGFFVRLPMVGFFSIGKVLFHELGHHIHRTKHPEFKEREDVADEWSKKLLKIAVWKRYKYAVPFLHPVVRILNPPLQKLVIWVNRRHSQKQLKRSQPNRLND